MKTKLFILMAVCHYGKQCNEQFQGNAEDFPAGKRILRWCARIGDIINVALASY